MAMEYEGLSQLSKEFLATKKIFYMDLVSEWEMSTSKSEAQWDALSYMIDAPLEVLPLYVNHPCQQLRSIVLKRLNEKN